MKETNRMVTQTCIFYFLFDCDDNFTPIIRLFPWLSVGCCDNFGTGFTAPDCRAPVLNHHNTIENVVIYQIPVFLKRRLPITQIDIAFSTYARAYVSRKFVNKTFSFRTFSAWKSFLLKPQVIIVECLKTF